MKHFKLSLLLLALLALLLPSIAAAHDDNPTLAVLSLGRSPSFWLTDSAILDTLEAYDMISEDERATLEGGDDLTGEKLNILYRDAGFDVATANLMVADALDKGVDVMLTLSTNVGYIASNMLSEMDDPPALIFAIVAVPYQLGLAQSPCIKPDYVTGTAMYFNFEEFQPIALHQDPDVETFGVLTNPSDPSNAFMLPAIENTLEYFGFSGEFASYTGVADLGAATQSLVDKEVDAIFMMPNMSATGGIPAIVQTAYGIPVYSMLVSDVHAGVTIAEGFDGWYREGAIAATMAVATLNGELDVARTAINSTQSFRSAVNLDSAREFGVDITDAALEHADYVIEDGEATGIMIELPGIGADMQELSSEERMARDAEWLASLACSDEMIAEQQAALDAMAEG